MEAIVLEPLGDVDGFDTSGFLEAPDIEDEFVGAAGVGVGVEDGVMRAEAGHDVVGVQESDFRGVG